MFPKKMVSPVRLELTTPCLKGRCSNQLSYGPNGLIIRFLKTKSRVSGIRVLKNGLGPLYSSGESWILIVGTEPIVIVVVGAPTGVSRRKAEAVVKSSDTIPEQIVFIILVVFDGMDAGLVLV